MESPRLQAELLLAHVLKSPRMNLYLDFGRTLASAEVEALREFVRRRGLREPLQHIVCSTSFCGLEMVVNRHVLVPRPETELLAEEGWRFLQTKSAGGGRSSVLDFGTGSGCIAIALAVKCPAAEILALDLSAGALETAKQNAARCNVGGRIHFAKGASAAALPGGIRFDLIISNPPYIPSAEIESLQPEVRDYDPRAALDGGADGLDVVRMLASDTVTFLEPGGRMMIEFGDGQADPVREIFENQNWIVETIRRDYTQQPRILVARR